MCSRRAGEREGARLSSTNCRPSPLVLATVTIKVRVQQRQHQKTPCEHGMRMFLLRWCAEAVQTVRAVASDYGAIHCVTCVSHYAKHV